jgi:hypothetical protein
MDRIARVRHRHRVLIVEHRQAKMRDALLRADRDNRLGLRIEIDVIAPSCTSCRSPCAAAERHATASSDASPSLRRFNQLVDDVLRRRAIRIPHPEVDDVLATLARRSLQLACDVEHIRRQPCQPSKLFHSGYQLLDVCLNLVFRGETNSLRHHHALTVDVKRHGQLVNSTIRWGDLTVGQQNRITNVDLLRGLLNLVLRGFIFRDPEDLEPLSRILRAELLEPGHLKFARGAPRRPEVHDYRSSLIVGQRDLFTFEAHKRERRGRLALQRLLLSFRRRPGRCLRFGAVIVLDHDVVLLCLLQRQSTLPQIVPTCPQHQADSCHHHKDNRSRPLHSEHPSGSRKQTRHQLNKSTASMARISTRLC